MLRMFLTTYDVCDIFLQQNSLEPQVTSETRLGSSLHPVCRIELYWVWRVTVESRPCSSTSLVCDQIVSLAPCRFAVYTAIANFESVFSSLLEYE